MSGNSMNPGSLMPHFGLFVPTIMGQGSDEQMMWWLPRAIVFQIVGCYAQTELGHGSNVRGLQTVATYAPNATPAPRAPPSRARRHGPPH